MIYTLLIYRSNKCDQRRLHFSDSEFEHKIFYTREALIDVWSRLIVDNQSNQEDDCSLRDTEYTLLIDGMDIHYCSDDHIIDMFGAIEEICKSRAHDIQVKLDAEEEERKLKQQTLAREAYLAHEKEVEMATYKKIKEKYDL